MKLKWFIPVFILALVFAAGQQQNVTPNQEIVLLLTSDNVSEAELQNTIAIVKEQLQLLGVDNIQVVENKSGDLKITYFSDTDVKEIKELLSNESKLKISFNENNKHKSSSESNPNIKLDIFEIQSHDSGFGIGGKLAIEIKSDKNQFLNSFVPTVQARINETIFDVKQSSSFSNYIEPSLKGTSLKIPDGRAGPIC